MRYAIWTTVLGGTLGVASLGAVPAVASEWWYTGGTADAAVFVDAATLVRDGSRAEMWQYDVFRAPLSGTQASKRRKSVDCRTLDSRLLQQVDYDDGGRASIPLIYTRLPPLYVAARTIAERGAHRFACADAGARAATGARPVGDPAAMAGTVLGPGAAIGR